MNKLPAFTISELLVVSILSLICAATAITAIKNFNANFNSYEADTSTTLQISNTYSLLKRDFSECKSVFIEDDFLIFNYPDLEIQYSIEQDQIIRFSNTLQSNQDTLLVGQFSFEVFNKKNRTEAGMIDHLDIAFQQDNISNILHFSFSKNYSAKTLMNGTEIR